MAEKDLLIKEKVEYSGVFSFSGLYKFVHAWLKDEEGYGVVEGKYSEKVGGSGREISVEWSASKGLGDYFKIELGIEFKASDLVDVEVEIDGQKKKMNKGKISVDMKGALIKDPKSKWEDTPLNKFLRDVYNKYVIPQRVDDREGMVKGNVKDLKEEIKSYLELSGKR
jgi:hypothetical protein